MSTPTAKLWQENRSGRKWKCLACDYLIVFQPTSIGKEPGPDVGKCDCKDFRWFMKDGVPSAYQGIRL